MAILLPREGTDFLERTSVRFWSSRATIRIKNKGTRVIGGFLSRLNTSKKQWIHLKHDAISVMPLSSFKLIRLAFISRNKSDNKITQGMTNFHTSSKEFKNTNYTCSSHDIDYSWKWQHKESIIRKSSPLKLVAFEAFTNGQYYDENQSNQDAQYYQLNFHVLEPHFPPHFGSLLSKILRLQ